jgi:hypothetical protein
MSVNGFYLNLFDRYISLIFIGVTRRVGTPVFFLSYLCRKKNEKKLFKSFKPQCRCRIFAPAFPESGPQTARITAASLLHHRCIAANTL